MTWSERLWSTWAQAVLLGGLALAACSGGTEAAKDAATPPQPASDTILIGEFGSLTGSEATFGQSTHNGILLAIDEANAAGGLNGKKFEVKVYDDQGKTQEAGTAVTRLITDDNVVAVLGEVASSLSIAGGRVAQQYGVPMISPSSTNAAVTQIGDMISRVCFVDSFQGYVGAKFATETLKFKKFAILYDQGAAYSKGLKDDFGKAVTSLGGTVVSEQAYSAGDSDFSAQLGSIRDAGAEAIYIPGYYTDVGNIALQARGLGIQATLIGGDGWDSAKLAEIGREAIEGAYYSNHYAPQETRPEVQQFVTAYQAKYGQVPDGLAALGYDAARVLVAAMHRTPSVSAITDAQTLQTARKELAASIAQTKDFAGVTGVITIDADRNAQKPAVVVQVKNGTPTWVASIQPAGAATPAPAPGDASAPGAPGAAAAPAPAAEPHAP